jgi:hypothetical protein
MSNFAIYMIGTILVTAAAAYGAHLLGLSMEWIVVIAIILLGMGIMGGVRKTRRREPSDAE